MLPPLIKSGWMHLSDPGNLTDWVDLGPHNLPQVGGPVGEWLYGDLNMGLIGLSSDTLT